jgi:hypothetical protein
MTSVQNTGELFGRTELSPFLESPFLESPFLQLQSVTAVLLRAAKSTFAILRNTLKLKRKAAFSSNGHNILKMRFQMIECIMIAIWS